MKKMRAIIASFLAVATLFSFTFCNSLVVGEDGMIEDFKMRIENSKLSTVKALQSIGFDTIASGDSYNDGS